MIRETLAKLHAVWKNYYVNRTAQAVFTLYVVVTLGFILMRLLPGGPIQRMKMQRLQECRQGRESSTGGGGSGGAARNCNLQRINERIEVLTNINPNQPILVQYWDWMSSFFTGDFGVSMWYNLPVIDLIAKALPWTMLLSASTTLFSTVMGITLGILLAYYEGSKFDIGLTTWTIINNSIPFYVLAVFGIFIFVYQLHWFPNGGQYTPGTTAGLNWPYVKGVLHHAALPVSVFVITGFGDAGLGMRANAIRILGSDYMRVARIRGLSAYRLAIRYVGRNAVLPIYTGLMMMFSSFVSGSVIIETIFKWPGMGYLIFNAVQRRDYPLMLAAFIMSTVLVILGMLIADFTYGYVDPRADQTESREAFGTGEGSIFVRIKRRVVSLWTDTPDAEEYVDDEDWDERFNAMTADERGDSEASVFDFSADAETSDSLTDRLFRKFDTYVYAPFMVLWSDIRGKIGISIITAYTLAGLIGPWVMTPPHTNEGPRFVAPFQSLQYPLGTDQMGQDLFALMVFATPPMYEMMFAGAAFATFVSTTLGILAGFKGGLTDRVIMTAADVVMTIPGLPLTILLAAILQPREPWQVALVLTIDAWGATARQIRSQTLPLRNESYVEASRAMGLSISTILFRDILPNLAPYALIKFMRKAKRVIFGSVALYFLGILPFTQVNWGVVLNMAYQSGTALVSWGAVHWFLVPAVTVNLFSFALILLAQAADQLTNPRVRARHSKTTEEDEVAEATAGGAA